MLRRTFMGGVAAVLAGGCVGEGPNGPMLYVGLPPKKPDPDSVDGVWDGQMNGANRTLQVILRVGPGAGDTGARIEFPEQPEQGRLIPSRLVKDGPRLVVTGANGGMTFELNLSPDGNALQGQMRLPNATAPIALRRRAPGARDPAIPGLEYGEIVVPEDRNNPRSRQIAVKYLRLKASGPGRPGSPLVVLAGGPGGTLIDPALKGQLGIWRFFDRDRDVILLDQRGAGRSNHIPEAPQVAPPRDFSYLHDPLVAFYRAETLRCWKWWESKGVAMSGYTTRQNAQDVDDLRRHLGAEKISLYGESYGSHLGLAILKYHGATVDRVCMAGIEGLDQTVKRPAMVDAMLARLAVKIAADPAAREAFPDFLGSIRRVHAKMDANPTQLPGPMGPMRADSFAAKLMLNEFVGATQALASLPLIYKTADEKGLEAAMKLMPPGVGIIPGISPMNIAMDTASGISDARLAQVAAEARTALIGDALNFPHPHLKGVLPVDLGDDFRAPFRTDVPALLMNGDLDGRTPLEEAREVAKQFTNATFHEVENFSHGGVTDEMSLMRVRFLRGEPAGPAPKLPPLRFRMV